VEQLHVAFARWMQSLPSGVAVMLGPQAAQSGLLFSEAIVLLILLQTHCNSAKDT
jgi:hypothetical protein